MRILEIITRVHLISKYSHDNHPNFNVKFDFKSLCSKTDLQLYKNRRKLNFLDQLICDDNLFVN